MAVKEQHNARGTFATFHVVYLGMIGPALSSFSQTIKYAAHIRRALSLHRKMRRSPQCGAMSRCGVKIKLCGVSLDFIGYPSGGDTVIWYNYASRYLV
jgi:hypothetical protein